MNEHYSARYTENHIQGNVYAITGGGSGFGKETAIEIVKMGGKVAIMGRKMEKLQGTVDAINDLGKGENVVAMAGDVSKYEDNVALVKLAVEKFGKLDAFFANAGIMPLARFKDYEKALPAWEQCIDINLKGNLFGMCASYEQFKKQGYGHFMTTSSIHGNFPTAGGSVYAATKIGVRYMANCLRVENPGLVKVTVINPTGVSSTGLFSTVVDLESSTGIFGTNIGQWQNKMGQIQQGGNPNLLDSENIEYFELNTEEMVWGIMFALNQPRGVSVTDVTMHASNDDFIL